MILLKLFISFLQIGAFSFGGGYAAMPLIQHQVVELHQWLSMVEFSDLITISQITPGPIAINSATFVGLKINGFIGALAATMGCIIPSCIIVSIIAYIYLKYQQMSIIQNILKYIRPAVVAMIGGSGLLIIVNSFFNGNVDLNHFQLMSVIIFASIPTVTRRWQDLPIIIIMSIGRGYLLPGMTVITGSSKRRSVTIRNTLPF